MIYKDRLIKRCKELSEEKRNMIITSVMDILQVNETRERPICKKCGENNAILKYGRDGTGKQRYHCKSCSATFTDISYTIVSHTHCNISQLKKVVECLFCGYSLQKCGEVCGISACAAFRIKHKILSVLQEEELERIIAKATNS